MARAAFLHLLRSQSSHHFSRNTRTAYHSFRSLTRGQPVSANPIFKASSQLALPQKRWASEAMTRGQPVSANPIFKAYSQLAVPQRRWASEAMTRGQPVSANPIFKAYSQLAVPQRRWASEAMTRGQPVSANPIFKASSQLAVPQRRWASEATTTQEDNKISIGPHSGGQFGEGDKETLVVYHGPQSAVLRKIKLLSLSLSLSACCLSIGHFFITSSVTNVIVNGALTSLFIYLTATGTVTFQRFLSPYIHKLRWQPGSDSFEVETISWPAAPKIIKFADIQPAGTNSPIATFKAHGNFYYVDAAHCHNEELLARLIPQQVTHESAFKSL